jgi:hypothetical protein
MKVCWQQEQCMDLLEPLLQWLQSTSPLSQNPRVATDSEHMEDAMVPFPETVLLRKAYVWACDGRCSLIDF